MVDDKWGFIDEHANLVIKPQFVFVDSFSEGLACVCKHQKLGYINTKGEMVIECKFDGADSFSEGRARVDKYIDNSWSNCKYGYIDSKGNPVTDFVFTDARRYFSEGLVAVKVDKHWGYIDKQGTFVIEPQYRNADMFHEGIAIIEIADLREVFIDKSGRPTIDKAFRQASDFSEGLAFVDLGYPTFIDKKGEKVFRLGAYDEASFFSDGVVAARKGNRLVYLDRTGKPVVIPDCDCNAISDFSEGRAAVRLGGKWGYIDKKGKLVIKAQFSLADKFINGWAHVVEADTGAHCYIDPNGKYIWRPPE
jgi:hypothetical protein